MKVSYFAVCVMMVLLLGEAPVSMAVTCDPMQLSPCAGAILSSSAPTRECCTKLQQQRPCLCNYLKDPSLQRYINSGNARRVASSCSTPFPNC
ncbi:non-specific lipid-transfer protein 2-like [Tasmannia lanceolata]|uniref:non-specific lipid-transfer protein 2-like n=1 Tax=Tasmannia lanceolata TaxID=3420 RepID=UPI004062AE6B